LDFFFKHSAFVIREKG
jgi:hypothetical protein